MKEKYETFETHILASAGAIAGANRYFVRPELTAKRAWLALAAGIVAYELVAPPGELMSEQFDRWLEAGRMSKVATVLGTLAVTGHLLNTFGNADPIHHGVEAIRRLR